MDLKHKMKLLLDEMGRGSKKKLADYLGVPPTYVTRWVGYDDYNIPRDQLPKIAKFFGVTTDYLLDDGQDISLSRKIPVIGPASCGIPTHYYNEDVEYIDVPAYVYGKSVYAISAEGDSMAQKINEGDVVVCDPDKGITTGDIVHYTINGESGIKKVKINEDSGTVTLIPLNQAHDTVTYTKDEIEDMKMAKCTHVISSL